MPIVNPGGTRLPTNAHILENNVGWYYHTGKSVSLSILSYNEMKCVHTFPNAINIEVGDFSVVSFTFLFLHVHERGILISHSITHGLKLYFHKQYFIEAIRQNLKSYN